MQTQFKKKPIYCIGGATIDYKFKTKSAIQLRSSNPVYSHTSFGGVARNVAENLANLTHPIYLQSVVGNDLKADTLLQHLSDKNINTSACLRLSNFGTAQYYAFLDDNNDLFIAAADMEIYEHIPFEDFAKSWEQWEENCIVFLDTNLSKELIEHAIKLSKTKQIQLCIDPISVDKAIKIPADLSDVYLIKPNQHQAEILSGIKINTIEDCFTAGKILLNRGVENAVISLGDQGYVLVNAQMCEHYSVKQFVEIVDTNGAGDAFVAGILFGLQSGLSIIEACKIGANMAISALQSFDSVVNSKLISDNKHASVY